MKIKDFQNSILSELTKLNNEEKLKGLTGEINLKITKEELGERMEFINPTYLEVMELEANILVNQGLFRGYFEGNDIIFEIPDWDKLLTAIHAFYETCYKD